VSKFNPIGIISKRIIDFIYPPITRYFLFKKRFVISTTDDFNHNFF